MNTDLDRPISYSCPYCEGRNIETAATAPYVRGFVLAFQIGSKSFIGCTACVRIKVLREAGLSVLVGWFSIIALIINPFLIVYNLLQAPFIRTNYAKARKKLNDAGVPDDQTSVDVTRLGYSLATSMMVADGRIDEEEVAVALAVGMKIFPDFSEEELRGVIKNARNLPSPQDIATLLREVLTDDGKKAVCSYLWMIAKADGNVDDSEEKLLAEVTANIGLDLAALESSSQGPVTQ